MRKLLLVLMMVALSIGIALAAVTWHSGPTFTCNGAGIWTASGDGSGFGNKPAVATITISGTATYTCQNPGGNTAPGQNQVTSIQTVSAGLGNADHNGRGVFDFSAGPYAPAPTVSGKAAGCPNGHWTGVNPLVVGTASATLAITQGSQTIFGPTDACSADTVGSCPGF